LKKLLRAICLLSLSCGGCAFTQADLNVGYDNAKAVKGPLSSIKPLQAAVGEFKDVRPERDKIGYKRNGFGTKTANIVTTKPVPDIIREAVTAELSKNGHVIAASNKDLLFTGEITNFWFDYQMNFWTIEFMGTVAVNLKLTDGKTGTALLSRQYQGYYNEKSMGGLNDTWERVMNTALERMVEEMSTDPKLIETLQKIQGPGSS
jgi:uncharacterized lipoprotein YajG